MKRYVTKAARWHDWIDSETYLARTVLEPDPTPRETGLLDANGNKLYAVEELDQIGFMRRQS